MLRGAGHAGSTLGSISSIDRSPLSLTWARTAVAQKQTKIAFATAARVAILRNLLMYLPSIHQSEARSLPHAALSRLGGSVRLVLVLRRPAAPDRVVGARARIDEQVVHVARDVRIGSERGHDVLRGGVYVLAAVHHHLEEVGISDPLERVLEPGREARALRVGAMAHVALGVIAAEARVGVPVDGAVGRDLVGRRAVLVVIFAVLVLDRGRIARAVGGGRRGKNENGEEHPRPEDRSHGRSLQH